MHYSFNPHRHIKIWLSKEKDTFLTLENQKRLIKARYLNPNDEFHFVYDSHLLNQNAQLNLEKFCCKHRLIPHDAHFLKGENNLEKTLITYYEKEILHVNNGGNLGAASDILRWISDIYRLGIYTDFDVKIDTQKLPKSMNVQQPVLIGLGSVQALGKEIIFIHNSILNVVDAYHASPIVQAIQSTMLMRLEDKDLFHTLLSETHELYAHEYGPLCGDILYDKFYGSQGLIFERLDKLRKSSDTMIELRQKIHALHKDNQSFCHFLGNTVKTIASCTRRAADSRWMESFSTHPDSQSLKNLTDKEDEELVTQLREEDHFTLLKSTVTASTGSLALLQGFFSKPITLNISEKFAAYAFSSYDLDKAFIVKAQLPFHSSLSAYERLLEETPKIQNKQSSSSWFEEDSNITKTRELKFLEKRNALQRSLSHRLTTLNININRHIEKIESERQGCFGFYRKHARTQKVNALKDIRSLFKEGKFDAEHLETKVKQYAPKVLFASIGKSRTKRLVQETTSLSNQATVYQLTDEEGYIALTAL